MEIFLLMVNPQVVGEQGALCRRCLGAEETAMHEERCAKLKRAMRLISYLDDKGQFFAGTLMKIKEPHKDEEKRYESCSRSGRTRRSWRQRRCSTSRTG